MRAVAVFGHTGFLGRSVTRQLLAGGINVLGVARSAPSQGTAGALPGLVEVACDIRTLDQVEQVFTRSPWPIDTVILLAAIIKFGNETVAIQRELFETNLVGTQNVLQVALAHRVPHVIFTSSMAVYGRPEGLPVNELHPRRPLSFYGLMKQHAEDLLLWSGRSGHTAITILRLAGLYGNSRASGAVYHFIRQAIRGETIRVDLTKPVIWDVLHVEDASDAVCAAAMQGGAGVRSFNLDQGEPVEVVSVARHIASRLGSPSEVVVEGHAESVAFQFDLDAARRELNYHPASLDERVREMAERLAVPA